VKIADFGVAKLAASTSMTQSGFVLGTPSYMSPEQAQGRAIDGRSDQFSLAVVAYRMLTGKLPFEAPTLTALLAKILWEEPEYESAGLRPPVLIVFKKALSKDPQMRYANCGEFVRELETAYAQHKAQLLNTAAGAAKEGGQPDAGIPVPPEAATPARETPSVGLEPPESQPLPTRRPKRKLIAWAAALAVAALAVIAFLTVKTLQKPGHPAAHSSGTPAAEVAPGTDHTPPRAAEAPPQAPEPGAISSAKSAASKPKLAAAPSKSASVASGTITWSGNLRKNADVVIGGQHASTGSVTGDFPGEPVEIEVEPKEITIRQMPGAENGWKQIILYSGNQKYSSITIRWRTLQ
jgi:serine/threonine-protein kinase